MTDNEIIKALECCQIKKVNECAKCPYLPKISRDCERFLVTDALDLINRQKAEIERLQETICMLTKTGRFYSTVRAEAIKEFAEMLRRKLIAGGIYPAFIKGTIEKVLEEMVGYV